jgi:hypothetical protein
MRGVIAGPNPAARAEEAVSRSRTRAVCAKRMCFFILDYTIIFKS